MQIKKKHMTIMIIVMIVSWDDLSDYLIIVILYSLLRIFIPLKILKPLDCDYLIHLKNNNYFITAIITSVVYTNHIYFFEKSSWNYVLSNLVFERDNSFFFAPRLGITLSWRRNLWQLYILWSEWKNFSVTCASAEL